MIIEVTYDETLFEGKICELLNLILSYSLFRRGRGWVLLRKILMFWLALLFNRILIWRVSIRIDIFLIYFLCICMVQLTNFVIPTLSLQKESTDFMAVIEEAILPNWAYPSHFELATGVVFDGLSAQGVPIATGVMIEVTRVRWKEFAVFVQLRLYAMGPPWAKSTLFKIYAAWLLLFAIIFTFNHLVWQHVFYMMLLLLLGIFAIWLSVLIIKLSCSLFL